MTKPKLKWHDWVVLCLVAPTLIIGAIPLMIAIMLGDFYRDRLKGLFK